MPQTWKGLAPRYWDGGYRARDQAAQIIKRGFVRLPVGQEYLADKIKQEYSRQAVRTAARKIGWQVKQKSPQKLTISRRD